MYKYIISIIGILALGGVVYAQTPGGLNVKQGGTGFTAVNEGSIIVGGTSLRLTSTTSPTVGYITATSTTATSTFAGGIQANGLKLLSFLEAPFANFTSGTSTITNLHVTGNAQVDGALFAPVSIVSSGNATINGTLNVTQGTNLATASGNVGIGTTAPGSLLNVGNSATANTTIRINNSLSAGSDTGMLSFGLDDSTLNLAGIKLDYSDRVAKGLEIFTTTGYGYPITLTPDTNKNILLNVTGTGNVGIGTTNPTVQLQLGKYDAQNILQITGTATADMAPTMELYRNGIGVWNQSVNTSNSFLISATSGHSDANLTSEAKLTIQSGGNVGIGTTSPSSLLSVQGNSYVSGSSFFGGAITGTSTLAISGTGDSYILGNVGIGTTNPTSLLQVQSTGTATSSIMGNNSVGDAAVLQLYDTSASHNWNIRMVDNSNGGVTSGRLAFNEGTFGNNQEASGGGEFLSILNTGNVGIGTTNPTEMLTIGGTAGATNRRALLFNAGWAEPAFSTSSNGERIIFYKDASYKIAMGMGASNDLWFQTGVGSDTTKAFRFFTSTTGGAEPTEKVTILGNGNVGIGTTTPFSKFHVTSGASATTTVSFASIGLTTSKTCFNVNQADGSAGSFYFAGGAMVFETNYCR